MPVAVLWAMSQGTYSYFFPRYVLFAVAGLAILAGIAVSRFNAVAAVAAVPLIALLGAADQGVIREPGAHNWADYPVSASRSYWNYAAAASLIARTGRGDGEEGIVFPSGIGRSYLMIDQGIRYYLEQDGAVVPRQLFIAATAQQADGLYPLACEHPAACAANEGKIWIIGLGHETEAWTALPPAEAAALRPHYHPNLTWYTEGLSIFLLQRDAPES
jgi:hypothetical protein